MMERLVMLRDFLFANAETIREKKIFNLNTWKANKVGNFTEKISLPVPGDGIVETNCGTVCCAVGFACLIPAFREQGLGLHRWIASEEPIFNRKCGTAAVAEFFGLSTAEVEWLFMPSSYGEWIDFPSKHEPLRVAERIDSLILLKRLEHIYNDR